MIDNTPEPDILAFANLTDADGVRGFAEGYLCQRTERAPADYSEVTDSDIRKAWFSKGMAMAAALRCGDPLLAARADTAAGNLLGVVDTIFGVRDSLLEAHMLPVALEAEFSSSINDAHAALVIELLALSRWSPHTPAWPAGYNDVDHAY